MKWLLFLGSFLLGCAMVAFLMNRGGPSNCHDIGKPPPNYVVRERQSFASKYVPPKDRSIEMQAFDKAMLFLQSLQEDDGHWSASKTGASPELSGVNGDILTTAIASYALLCSSQRKEQNREAVTAARRGVDWLMARQKENGLIADESAPGEPVVTQMFSALALLQSASMSTRDKMRASAVNAAKYAILEMKATCDGYGPVPKAPAARADVTGLATFLFRTSLMDDVKFSTKPDNSDATMVATQIENSLKAAVKLLSIPDRDNGVFNVSSAEQKLDWDATASGLLTQVLLFVQPSALAPTVKFILKPYDEEKGTYPGVLQEVKWGERGEGYRAFSMWQTTLSMIYLYQEHTKEWKGWTAATNPILLGKQREDGGWDVAGPDAARGQVWRASLNALTLLLLAPTPPPPPPPAN